MRLANKVAIITGAASGFGRATACLFAKEGGKVVVADISDAGGAETVTTIKQGGGEAIFVHTDVSVASEVQHLIKACVDAFGRIDILFNNAGMARPRPTELENVKESEWDRIFAVNVKSIFLAAKYAVPEMRKVGGGVIINTASVGWHRVRPYIIDYVSSKGAVITLTKALAIELAPSKIRVNAINPAAGETPMLPSFYREGTLEEIKKSAGSLLPLGRLVKPEDVAYAALYLASDESSMVTGSSVDVDGGRGI